MTAHVSVSALTTYRFQLDIYVMTITTAHSSFEVFDV